MRVDRDGIVAQIAKLAKDRVCELAGVSRYPRDSDALAGQKICN